MTLPVRPMYKIDRRGGGPKIVLYRNIRKLLFDLTMTEPREVTCCFRNVSFLFRYTTDSNTRMIKDLIMFKISTTHSRNSYLSVYLLTRWGLVRRMFPHFHWSIQIKTGEEGGTAGYYGGVSQNEFIP